MSTRPCAILNDLAATAAVVASASKLAATAPKFGKAKKAP
jgi:hypothetical protein